MQYKNDKTELLAKTIGEIIKSIRLNKGEYSINRFANEFDLDVGNVSRIENGLIECKVVTLWKIAEALGMKFSEFSKLIEEKLGADFYFYED